jgi:hypothetical protein
MRDQRSLRMAQPGDIDGIVSLVNGYAFDSVMLPITSERVALALADFIVAADARGRVRACGALKEYSPSLAEIASLAVARSVRAILRRFAGTARRARGASAATKYASRGCCGLTRSSTRRRTLSRAIVPARDRAHQLRTRQIRKRSARPRVS